MFWGLFKNTKGKHRKKCPLLFTGWFKCTLNTSFIFCKKKSFFLCHSVQTHTPTILPAVLPAAYGGHAPALLIYAWATGGLTGGLRRKRRPLGSSAVPLKPVVAAVIPAQTPVHQDRPATEKQSQTLPHSYRLCRQTGSCSEHDKFVWLRWILKIAFFF